jgi:hypothetical protein
MSSVTLKNSTNEVVSLALYKVPVVRPGLDAIAWKIVSPPPGGYATVNIPDSHAVTARYSGNSADPASLDTQTAALAFSETTAAFSIDAIASQDRHASGAVITQRFEDLVMNEVRIVNNYGVGVEAAILLDGSPIYAPQVVWPGALLVEDIRSSIHVAVVAPFTRKGDRLVQAEYGLTQTEVLEGGTLIVTGSIWTGYALSAAE